MILDPFLYVALGTGYLVGRLVGRRAPWVGRAALASVFVLLVFLGGTLAASPPESLLLAIPLAVLLVSLVLGITVALVVFLPRRLGRPSRPRLQIPIYVPLYLVALVAGYALGRFVIVPYGSWLTWALYALLFFVAWDLVLSWTSLRRLAVPLAAAAGGAVIGGVVFALIIPVDPRVAFASALGFGWYSLAGPLVGARFGAAAGLIAFLSNFLREDLTMVLAPVVGPWEGPEAVTAMGGATTMDTTLFFVTTYGDPDAGSLALASGLILTLSASILIPVILALP